MGVEGESDAPVEDVVFTTIRCFLLFLFLCLCASLSAESSAEHSETVSDMLVLREDEAKYKFIFGEHVPSAADVCGEGVFAPVAPRSLSWSPCLRP